MLDGTGGHKKLDEAVRTLHKYGAPPAAQHLPMYRDLTRRILGRNKKQEGETDQAAVVTDLRTVLYNLRSRATGKEVRRQPQAHAAHKHMRHIAAYMTGFYFLDDGDSRWWACADEFGVCVCPRRRTTRCWPSWRRCSWPCTT